jgi:hypothetical protein
VGSGYGGADIDIVGVVEVEVVEAFRSYSATGI